MKQYDVIVIGGGPGGAEAAAIAAERGLSVALVEQSRLGGTCLNRGCIPTKCLCAAAGRLLALADAAEFGIELTGLKADYTVAHRRAAEVMDTLRDDLSSTLSKVDLIEGRARIGEGRTVVAGTEFMKARHLVLATGSKPAPLKVPGAELAMSSDDFLDLETLPQSVVIVGGGVIGLEFASVLAAYGSSVTVLEYCKEVLPAFDSEVAKRLRSYLSRRGIKFVLGAEVKEIGGEPGAVTVSYEAKGKVCQISAEAVLASVGRKAVLPEGISEAGVDLDSRGFVCVDEKFATSAPGISAIGDINGKCMLAHAASAQARVAMGVCVSTGVVPSVVFTVPECASVGAKEADSESYRAVKVPYSANGKAVADGHSDGFVKMVCDSDSRIVGCQAVGAHAADLIAEAAVLIDAGIKAPDFAAQAVSAHPGLSELLQTAAARF
ncbi:MAG: FAD-dependent oxidoreductase [Muribaculaceae bacterium]|nr:FAD-dependent oxidoreductase [Muribaculaceae bacterium]